MNSEKLDSCANCANAAARPLILSGSPRRGNSLYAAQLAATAITDKAGAQCELLELRNHIVRPCVDCGACSRAAGRFPAYPGSLCPLAGGLGLTGRTGQNGADSSSQDWHASKGCQNEQNGNQQADRRPCLSGDQCDAIFKRFLSAPFVVLTAPIYFYHLPAQLKALLDRSQLFWQAKLQGCEFVPQKPRNVWCVLLGARERGEKLFEGSLLTLKYALEPFGLTLRDPLTLHGLEQSEDLAASPEVRQKVIDYAARVAEAEFGK